MKSARRRAREYALQGLYQWQMSGNTVADIRAHLAADTHFAKADSEYFAQLLAGTIAAAEDLKQEIAPALDRKVEELSPVERGILLLAAWELKHAQDVPFRVVINEAIELAKCYSTDKSGPFVNGVLDAVLKKMQADRRQASDEKG